MDGFESNNKLLLIIGIIILVSIVSLAFFFSSNSKSNISSGNANSEAVRATISNNIPGEKKLTSKKPNDFSFTPQERPAFKFPSVAYASDLKDKTAIYNSSGTKVDAKLSVNKSGNGSVVELNPSEKFMPGKYTLVINDNGRKISQDFTWGVLAINTNKSIYSPGETALLALAVLDEKGKMVCNAKVTLKITDPKGHITIATTDNGIIKVNKECFIKALTTKPDYETAYKVQDSGTYQMELTAVTKNGTFQIQDSFLVQNSVDFDIERETATRIFPFSVYPVVIKITAHKDFEGQITEVVPDLITLSKLENVVTYKDIQDKNGNFYLTWTVSIKKGQTINIGYNFKAPEISPQFYLLGPLTLATGSSIVFQENRNWQLAIDDVNYSTAILATPGLIHYYRLGEPSGTNLVDSIGTSSGTYFNAPNLAQAGAIIADPNTAVKFNSASSQYADVNNVSNWGGGPVSFELWYKRAAVAQTDKGFLQRTDGVSADRWYILLCGFSCSPSGQFVEFGGAIGNVGTQSTVAITDTTTWHHIVGVKGSTASDWKIYIDGADVSGAVGSGTPGNDYGIMKIGVDVVNDFQNGFLDEIAIYNVALTAAQIKAHYDLGILSDFTNTTSCTTLIKDTPGLISYWRLGEPSGTTATDAFGLNNGTYNNAPTLGVAGAIYSDSDTAATFTRASSQDISIPDSASLRLSTPITYELWYKNTTSDGTTSTLVSQSNNNTVAMNINGIANGNVRISTNAGGEGAHSAINLTDTTTWHHVVGTVDGFNNYKIYIDGVDQTVTVGTPGVVTPVSANTTSIASFGGGGWINGSMDDVAIYHAALTQAQVLQHYQVCAGPLSRGNFRFENLQLQGLMIN